MSSLPRFRLHKTADKLWVHLNGQTFSLPLHPETATTAAAAKASVETNAIVRAPMPASVINVKCKLKDRVQTGDLLCVLEAMKMEYQLLAPHDGKINKIYCRAGSRVALGDPLIEVTP